MVGAYRDEAVGPEHPLNALLSASATPGATTGRIVLSPLGSDAVAAMVADMLDRPEPIIDIGAATRSSATFNRTRASWLTSVIMRP
ncbi:hypothetical protein ACMHYB_22540 [Sorangium sp. So ce1128]